MKVPTQTTLHFVGIGGIGMSGIAEVLNNQGYKVTGSDLLESETTRRLARLGITVNAGHDAMHIGNADVVVISSAVKLTNPEVIEAKRRRIPVIPRAEMLGELMRGKVGIAVAGSHGKTTTSSMLGQVLHTAGWDPTIIVGGRVNTLGGGGAKLGQGKTIVVEADESDGSFLKLPATYSVITNIDNDHLDYFGTYEDLKKAFLEFAGNIPFYGTTAVCLDDPGIAGVLDRLTKPFITYGSSEQAEIRCIGVKMNANGTRFFVSRRNAGLTGSTHLGEIELKIPGFHNVLNALGVVALCDRLEVPFEKVAEGLSQFQGVSRRFDVRYKSQRRAIVDDYGHHPTEIKATLQAARSFWPGRIVTVFQPHRFSRTQHCFEDFVQAFGLSDLTLIADIYPAGEDPIDGVSSDRLVTAIQQKHPDARVHAVGNLEGALKETLMQFQDGDLVLCLGAGSITKLPEQLIENAHLT